MSNGPLIGITVDASPDPSDKRTRGKLTLNWNYAQAIADAGGVPVLLPPQALPEQVAGIIDGWLIPGGDDIDPTYWGEPLHPAAKLIDPARHEFERSLYAAVDPRMPILGVCYGCQLLNVVEGGSLTQHLPDQVGHSDDQGGILQHYRVAAGSQTHAVLSSTCPEGESWHHQAIARIADSFVATAWNTDGTVEGIESRERPWVVGIQWHPERTPDAAETQSLFREFVGAASRYRLTKGGIA